MSIQTLRGTVLFTLFMSGLSACSPVLPTLLNRSTSSQPVVTSSNGPKVVATTTILCDLTKRIAGETIALTCLMPPGIDSHVYEAVPENRKAIEEAKLIVYSGYGLEASLIKLIQSTSNPAAKIAVAEAAVPKPLISEHSEHHHGHSSQQQETETELDPHVWQDAENGIRMVSVIQTALTKLVPEKADLYAKNAQALKTELSQIDRWIQTQVASIPPDQKKLVTTHEALGYYAAAYGIPVKGALQGMTTEEKPTAARVKQLVDQVRAAQVPTLFAEVGINPKLIQTVARETKVKISTHQLYSDSLGAPGSEADTYPKMLVANTRTIVEGLGGQYVAFRSP